MLPRTDFWDVDHPSNWFSKCRACTRYSYVAKKSRVRKPSCRGCMRPSCSSFRGGEAVDGLQEAVDLYDTEVLEF